MTDTKISALTAATSLGNTDELVLAVAGANKKITGANLKASIGAVPSAVLFDSTLGSDTASIDTGAGGIAGGYNLLEIYTLVRTDDVTAQATVLFTVNNDTGANYDRQVLSGANTTASAGFVAAANNWPFVVHGSGGTASYASIVTMTFPGYTQTTFFKAALATNALPDGTAANGAAVIYAFGYRSTAAITRMAIAASGAAKLRAGSRLLIYGR